MLSRLIGLIVVAVCAALAGLAVGVLVAPARGSETRAWLASLVGEHGPAFKQQVEKAREQVGSAVDYVVTQVETARDD